MDQRGTDEAKGDGAYGCEDREAIYEAEATGQIIAGQGKDYACTQFHDGGYRFRRAFFGDGDKKRETTAAKGRTTKMRIMRLPFNVSCRKAPGSTDEAM